MPPSTAFHLRELPRTERPRERLKSLGAHALSSAELLAILIGTGSSGRSALAVAHDALARSEGSLRRLATQPVAGLTSVAGLGSARAVAIQTMENGAGQRVFPGGVQASGLPPIQIASAIPDDKVIFVDTNFAMLRLVNRPFGTEFDRSAQTQVEGTYGTSIELVVPLFRYARLILDA